VPEAGGILAVSTPNHEHVVHANRADPFDMPPHHMGHFSPEVFRRVGRFLGLELVQVSQEPQFFRPEDVSEATRRSFSYRAARKLSRMLLDLAYRVNAEPGPGLLAVFRKPARE
jgi:hypothetical protein